MGANKGKQTLADFVYLRVVDELSKLGGRVSTSDKVLFFWHQNKRLIGMSIVHVDDFVGCGTAAFFKRQFLNIS